MPSRHDDRDRRDTEQDQGRSHRSSHHHRSSSSRKRSPESDRERDRDRQSSHSHRRDRDQIDSKSSSRHQRDRDRDREDRRHAGASSSSKRRETSEERRERKAAKRAKRERELAEYNFEEEDSAVADRAAAAELMMYSADNNPFNDVNLGQKFTWGKKEEKDRKLGLSKKEAELKDQQRRQEAKAEIEKLNARRAEREKEQAIREEEEARMARLAESAQMAEWVAKEDDFYLEQSKKRAAIRIRENRAKPIDILSINLKWADPALGERKLLDGQETGADADANALDNDDEDKDEEEEEEDEAGLEIDLEEPYNIFENLTIGETEELHQDIKMYLSLEKNEANLDFWRSMLIVCDDKLEELKDAAGQAPGSGHAPAPRLDVSEKARINDMLSVKNTEELLDLQEQVRSKLASGEPLDVEYWERVLKSIVVWRAKAKLRDMHEVVLSNRIEYLQRKQRDEALRQQRNLLNQLGDDSLDSHRIAADAAAQAEEGLHAEREVAEAAELEALYDPEEMEPEPVDWNKLRYDDRQLPVYTVEEDRQRIVAARRRVVGAIFIPRARGEDSAMGEDGDPAAALFRREANKALDVEEETFNQDESLARQIYQWEDKYRPRKPRYFNRVHTGYEWNKYNQTHYDTDNPPPKIVQGYKFNIFYPDLIDKQVAPTYRIVKEPGNKDTVLLRFSAGPPYEDIAFRIVNREWEHSHRRGFRSSFDRGILQLYFNFKRLRYRK